MVARLLAVLDVHLVLWMCVAIYLLCQLYTHKCNCMLSATHCHYPWLSLATYCKCACVGECGYTYACTCILQGRTQLVPAWSTINKGLTFTHCSESPGKRTEQLVTNDADVYCRYAHTYTPSDQNILYKGVIHHSTKHSIMHGRVKFSNNYEYIP